jgi:two-component system, cell cycle response regulator
MRANQLAMEAELAYIELNQIFRTAPGGILLVDRDFNVMRHNEAFRKLAGIGEQQAVGSKCYQVFGSDRCHSPKCPVTRIFGGEKRIQYEGQRHHAGTEVHYLVSGSPFQAPDGELIGAVLHLIDISGRVRAERTLRESERRYMELSTIDELTKLYNKRYFNEQLGREIARTWRYKHPLTILMLDIDDFKIHNDTYGHAEGDRVLARIGELLRANLRTSDVPCRYGGEEFVVILPETSGEQAMVVAERIRGSIAGEEFQPGPGARVGKTVSLGIAQYVPGEEGEELVVRADRNLYQAKLQGKNQIVLAAGGD